LRQYHRLILEILRPEKVVVDVAELPFSLVLVTMLMVMPHCSQQMSADELNQARFVRFS